jgi:hypothetical protein
VGLCWLYMAGNRDRLPHGRQAVLALNAYTATVAFLSAGITRPVSVLMFEGYVLGMCSGGFVLALLRTWIQGAAQPW